MKVLEVSLLIGNFAENLANSIHGIGKDSAADDCHENHIDLFLHADRGDIC